MAERPVGIGSFASSEIAIAEPECHEQPALSAGASMQEKTVRLGGHEPAVLTFLRRGALPLAAVIMLTACVALSGRGLSLRYGALAIVTFLVSSQIFSPLDLRGQQLAAGCSRGAAIRVFLEWSCAAALIMFLDSAFNVHIVTKHMTLGWYLGTTAGLLLVASVSVPLARRLTADPVATERYIIIGANDVGLELARRLAHTHGAGRFWGFCDHRGAERLLKVPETPVTPNCSARDFANYVRANSISRVYIALPLSNAPRIEELLRELRDTTASVYFVPNIFAFDLVQARCVEINGMPAFSVCDSPLQGANAFWKSAFDMTLAIVLLLLLWPILLALAVAIKLSSPGPVLFRQRRHGLNGEEISVYKFRSMTVCEDGPVITQASRRDARLTPIGALLRRTSMDELPQILNVLEGKMSFVGPRPHAVAHNEEYRKLISGYMIRHKVRPGITGLAQINGSRGATATVDKMQQRVRYDIEYLKNWSFGLDLKILARTVLTVLFHTNAY